MRRKIRKQRLYLIGLSVVLLGLMTLVFWQTSLSFGGFRPDDVQQTLVLWGISTLVFLGMVTLGFILFRNVVKLYIERRGNRLGSKIKTKLVAGALGLTILPVVFLFSFSFQVLNRTLDKWFNQPIEDLQKDALAINSRLKDVAQDKAETLAEWIASLAEVSAALEDGRHIPELEKKLRQFALAHQVSYVAVGDNARPAPLVEHAAGADLRGLWHKALPSTSAVNPTFSGKSPDVVLAFRPVGRVGWVVAGWPMPEHLAAKQKALDARYHSYKEQATYWRSLRYSYLALLSLITLFILFVATWVALYLSRQIVAPIEGLVQATAQLSSGRLDYRIEMRAIDELGLLVRSFNQMAEQLEHSRDELDARRRYTEVILESIPTGVISLSAGGEILRVNPALGRIFTPERAAPARWLEDLFSPDDAARVRRLIRRAQRTGLATGTLDLETGGQTQHLAITVSALEQDGRSETSGVPRGCVIVLEDMSELLRAQKSAAWQEVAKRVAHEIKNPLTPIALSAERISRLLERYSPSQDLRARIELERLLHSCTATITREIVTLKTLVDEFSQFARFPAAQPEPGDLNEVVEAALDTYNGRLAGLHVSKHLAPGLPQVAVDPEQFRRAVVNLVDNAIEAINADPVTAEREVTIATALGADGDTVELVVADTGHGIAPEDREKLFLPYFSTRERGTGLGLAIVSRIVAEHKGAIRVEDNRPRGARFVVEIPTVESKAAVGVG